MFSVRWMDAGIFDLCFERQDQRSNTEASQGKSGSFSPRPTLAKIFFWETEKTYLEAKVGKYPPEPAAGKRGWHE